MDLSRYNRAHAARDGAWMHLEHPETRELLFAVGPLKADPDAGIEDGWNALTEKEAEGFPDAEKLPVRFKLQGLASPAIRGLRRSHEDRVELMRLRRKAITPDQMVSLNNDIQDEIDTHGLDILLRGILVWENVPWAGGLLEFNDANKAMLMPRVGQLDSPTEWIAQQIGEFMRSSSFLPKRATNASD